MNSKDEALFGRDETITQTVEGANHSLFLTNRNRLFAKGKNAFGQLGLGHFKDQTDMMLCTVSLNQDEEIKNIAVGTFHSLLLTNQNRVLGSGFNYLGQLGLGDVTVRTTFEASTLVLNENELITEIEAGFDCSRLKTNQNRTITFGKEAIPCKPTLFSPKKELRAEDTGMECSLFFI